MPESLISHLPKPPEGKKGWPWTEETDPRVYKEGIEFPKVSIITPSFNQGQFIEETIRSVLLQNYPNLEFIIIDGGSTDNTLEIIKKYEPWISYWVSEKDRGQSHALNKGFEKATGDWIGWQNSDDLYSKDAFSNFTKYYPFSFDVYFGNCNIIDNRSHITYVQYYAPFSFTELKYSGWNITNQACFFRKIIFNHVKIDEKLRYAMDGDLFFKIATENYKFNYINQTLGSFRLHSQAKTGSFDLDIGVKEWIQVRAIYNITQTTEPWKNQYRLYKLFFKIRKLFYLIINGNIIKYIKLKK